MGVGTMLWCVVLWRCDVGVGAGVGVVVCDCTKCVVGVGCVICDGCDDDGLLLLLL